MHQTFEKVIAIATAGEDSLVVTDELTVGFTVPGMPMVFATPQMIHAMEVVCAASIAASLPDGWVSVGTHVNVSHLMATPVGATVTTRSKVTQVSGQRINFEVVALRGEQVIGRGSHTRSCVELQRFLADTTR